MTDLVLLELEENIRKNCKYPTPKFNYKGHTIQVQVYEVPNAVQAFVDDKKVYGQLGVTLENVKNYVTDIATAIDTHINKLAK